MPLLFCSFSSIYSPMQLVFIKVASLVRSHIQASSFFVVQRVNILKVSFFSTFIIFYSVLIVFLIIFPFYLLTPPFFFSFTLIFVRLLILGFILTLLRPRRFVVFWDWTRRRLLCSWKRKKKMRFPLTLNSYWPKYSPLLLLLPGILFVISSILPDDFYQNFPVFLLIFSIILCNCNLDSAESMLFWLKTCNQSLKQIE